MRNTKKMLVRNVHDRVKYSQCPTFLARGLRWTHLSPHTCRLCGSIPHFAESVALVRFGRLRGTFTVRTLVSILFHTLVDFAAFWKTRFCGESSRSFEG